MGLFSALFSSFSAEPNSNISESSFHGGVNTDGTPMADDFVDINGDPYGCPSSDDDLFPDDSMNSDDMFDDNDF